MVVPRYYSVPGAKETPSEGTEERFSDSTCDHPCDVACSGTADSLGKLVVPYARDLILRYDREQVEEIKGGIRGKFGRLNGMSLVVEFSPAVCLSRCGIHSHGA